jgi:hypothetical protein
VVRADARIKIKTLRSDAIKKAAKRPLSDAI